MKAFVINLDRSPNRWESFRRANSRLEADIERIVAVDGLLLQDKWQHLSRWMHVTHEHCKLNIHAAIGCYLSHRKCWQQVINQDLPFALVLEDDAQATHYANDLLASYESCPLPVDWLKLHVHRYPNRRDMQKDLGRQLGGLNLCVDMRGSKSACAYIITQSGAQKALRAEKLLAPIDHLEWLYLRQGLIFCQTQVNVFEPAAEHESKISSQPSAIWRRWPAICRIGLLRLTLGRQALRMNYFKAMETFSTWQVQGARSRKT